MEYVDPLPCSRERWAVVSVEAVVRAGCSPQRAEGEGYAGKPAAGVAVGRYRRSGEGRGEAVVNWEARYVIGVTVVASLLFVGGRVRRDAVACLVLMALGVAGILSPEEIFAGFGNPVVVTVSGLLILGQILSRTGIAAAIGRWLSGYTEGSEAQLMIRLMLSAAALGSLLSSTAVVALLIPVMIQLDNRSEFNLTRLLLPLSYAALIGGTLTLIASPPNLIASSVLANAGYQDFNFFTFTPVGFMLLGLGVGYMVLMGRHLLPERDISPRDLPGSGRELLEAYGVAAIGHLFSIPRGSPLVGQQLRDSLLGTAHARVLLLERLAGFETLVRSDPDGDTLFSAGDVIVVVCADELAATLESELYLERRQLGKAQYDRWSRDLGTLVVLVHPDSALIGRSIQSVGFRSRYGLQVLGIRRRCEAITRLEDERLESGDALLLAGSWPRIQALQASPAGFVVLEPPREMDQYVPERRKAPIALGIVALMVACVAFELLPMVYSVLLAVGAGVATGCIKLDQAYRALPWSTIVVIAGLLPLAEALRVTGGSDMIVGELARHLWYAGPLHMLGGLFILTSVMGLVMPNVATAVLVAPMAIRAAEMLQVQPQAFVMAVAVAASTAFIAPYSTPAANLVFEPGGYRFRDFVKVGFPLWLLSLGFSLLVLPLLFPFAG